MTARRLQGICVLCLEGLWISLLVLAIVGVLAARVLWEIGYVEFELFAPWIALGAGVSGIVAIAGLAAREKIVVRCILLSIWALFFVLMFRGSVQSVIAGLGEEAWTT